jgi:2-methylcitrate dehydratase
MDDTTARLAGWTAGLSRDHLTDAALHAARRSLVDSVGCAYGAWSEPAMAALRDVAATCSSTTPATVLGTGVRSTPELAAFANGSMIRYLDFSDDYFGGAGTIGPHPSDNLGGVLAAAETVHADGVDLLMGLVAAYEVVGQVVDRIRLPEGKRHWDYTTLHAMGSSMGAGRVLGLDGAQLAHALGIATVANLSLQQSRFGTISDWKGLAGPDASSRGLYAARLAGHGITGPDEPFDGRSGLHALLGTALPLGELGGEGRPFRIEGTFFKCLPVRYNSQTPIWAAVELGERLTERGLGPSDVARLQVDLVSRYVTTREESPQSWDPRTPGTADHSFGYLVAAAVVDGEVTRRTLTAERFRDPVILDLLSRVDMSPDEAFTAAFPGSLRSRVTAELVGGGSLVVEHADPKGTPANPMSDDELGAKFLDQSAAVLSEARAREVLDRLWHVEEVEDVGELMGHLVVGA